jgi:hypothetical protein
MDQREEKLIRFGEGPWLDEPDRVEWRAHGFVCLVVRGPVGALCGYVGVPPGHPWHGQGYDDVEAEAHGGLTYAEHCAGHVCHVPAPGEPEHLYWLGFDCAHMHDYAPATEHAIKRIRLGRELERYPVTAYRSLPWVQEETERLAAQAASAMP